MKGRHFARLGSRLGPRPRVLWPRAAAKKSRALTRGKVSGLNLLTSKPCNAPGSTDNFIFFYKVSGLSLLTSKPCNAPGSTDKPLVLVIYPFFFLIFFSGTSDSLKTPPRETSQAPHKARMEVTGMMANSGSPRKARQDVAKIQRLYAPMPYIGRRQQQQGPLEPVA